MTDLERLALYVGNDAEPVLSPDELANLLADVARRDAYGLPPSDVAWTPTYDVHRAAATGWRVKAARVATDYNLQVGNKTLSRSQMLDHCLRMAREHSKLSLPRSISLGSGPHVLADFWPEDRWPWMP